MKNIKTRMSPLDVRFSDDIKEQIRMTAGITHKSISDTARTAMELGLNAIKNIADDLEVEKQA